MNKVCLQGRSFCEKTEFYSGICAWIVFCVVAVILRGYRWEESVEFAQILSGQVVYPESHPTNIYVHNAYSLQTYASAVLMALLKSAALFCAMRNVLHLLATVIPVFLLTKLLTRKTHVAHAAAIFALMGVLHEFDGTYPISVWPGLGSIGHFGTGYALSVLYFLAAGRMRTAFFMLGLMPCIHLGQMPALLGLFIIIGVLCWRQGDSSKFRGYVYAFGAGLFVCFAFWVVMQFFKAGEASSGAYFSEFSAQEAWRHYLAKDGHRSIPIGGTNINSHFAIVCMLILGTGAIRRELSEGGREQVWMRLLLYSLVVSATVWVVMIVHMILGNDIPYLMIVWMPYRLANHIPFILLACIVGILCGSGPSSSLRRAGSLAIAMTMLFFIVRPVLGKVLGADVFGRYLASGDIAAFCMCGAAFGSLFISLKYDRRFLVLWVSTAFITLALFGVFHQFGAVCCVIGAVSFLIAERMLRASSTQQFVSPVLHCALCLIAVLLILFQQNKGSSYRPVSDFDMRVAEYLELEQNPAGLVAAPPFDFYLQGRIRHAVVEEFNLESVISYMPSLGPSIYKIYRDVYGLDLLAAKGERKPRTYWREEWARRTGDEWVSLGRGYSIRYVLVRGEMQLDLPEVFREQGGALYKIPL